jgi:hypothetical protein
MRAMLIHNGPCSTLSFDLDVSLVTWLASKEISVDRVAVVRDGGLEIDSTGTERSVSAHLGVHAQFRNWADTLPS